jgi:hypothetical protein
VEHKVDTGITITKSDHTIFRELLKIGSPSEVQPPPAPKALKDESVVITNTETVQPPEAQKEVIVMAQSEPAQPPVAEKKEETEETVVLTPPPTVQPPANATEATTPPIELEATPTKPIPPPDAELVSEEEAAKDLPYLFTQSSPSPSVAPPQAFSAPPSIDNADQSDLNTLKSYLQLREQDLSVLSAQLSYAKEELTKSEETIRRLELLNSDYARQIEDLTKRTETFEQERAHAEKTMQDEIEDLKQIAKAKSDRIRLLEDRLNDSSAQYESLKERVRIDIRKIRVREKELESKLEILKRDSETLIAARENKILELKRKVDLLDFNADVLQEKNEAEKQNVIKAYEKLERVLRILRLASGTMDEDGEPIAKAKSA